MGDPPDPKEDPKEEVTTDIIIPSDKNKRRSITSPLCTRAACSIDINEENKFECKACSRKVHYRCSDLPLYQIHHFVTKKYRHYICQTCTTIPDDLYDAFPAPPTTHSSETKSSGHKKDNENQNEVDVLVESNRLLNNRIQELNTEFLKREKQMQKELDKLTKQLKEKDTTKLQEENKKLNDVVKQKNVEMKNLNSSIEKYHKTIETQRVTESKIKKEVIDLERQINEQESRISNAGKTDHDHFAAMEKKMHLQLQEIGASLRASISEEVKKNNQALEEKIGLLTQQTHIDETTTPATPYNIPPAPQPMDFRNIMKEAENEKLAEDNAKKIRASNVILHGVLESENKDTNACKLHDEEFVKGFITAIGIEVEYKAMFRLGKREKEPSKRPIKVILKSELDKERFMNNLKNLKGREEYKGISVKDDYTIQERNLVKQWVEKANEANKKETPESNYEWKVRGNPKNGMFIKRFQKRVTQPALQE